MWWVSGFLSGWSTSSQEISSTTIHLLQHSTTCHVNMYISAKSAKSDKYKSAKYKSAKYIPTKDCSFVNFLTGDLFHYYPFAPTQCDVSCKYIQAKEFHDVSGRPVQFQKDKNIPVLNGLWQPYFFRKCLGISYLFLLLMGVHLLVLLVFLWVFVGVFLWVFSRIFSSVFLHAFFSRVFLWVFL